jgi:type IV secretion system protein VirB8
LPGPVVQTVSEDAALERYFKEAASWDADRTAMNVRSNRIAWWIAIGACVLTVILGLALLALMPLKRVEPFLIRVDSSTGIVDVVPVFTGGAAMPETVTRYFLSHYITVCERFSFSTAESDYEECASFNAPARNQAWYTLWDRGNPLSPLTIHKDGSTVRAEVGAVTFFQRGSGVQDLAQVRYTKSTRRSGNSADQVSHWIATISYAYSDPAHDARARRWNPLGFKVIDFKSEPEVESTPALINASPTKATAPAPEATP